VVVSEGVDSFFHVVIVCPHPIIFFAGGAGPERVVALVYFFWDFVFEFLFGNQVEWGVAEGTTSEEEGLIRRDLL
jgi:hypothetical protein